MSVQCIQNTGLIVSNSCHYWAIYLGILFCFCVSIYIYIYQALVEHQKFQKKNLKKTENVQIKFQFLTPFKLYKSLIKLHVLFSLFFWCFFFRHRCYGHWILLLSFQSVLIVRNPRYLFIFFSKKIWLMAFISFKELARLLLIIMILLQQKLTIHVHVLLLSYTL